MSDEGSRNYDTQVHVTIKSIAPGDTQLLFRMLAGYAEPNSLKKPSQHELTAKIQSYRACKVYENIRNLAPSDAEALVRFQGPGADLVRKYGGRDPAEDLNAPAPSISAPVAPLPAGFSDAPPSAIRPVAAVPYREGIDGSWPYGDTYRAEDEEKIKRLPKKYATHRDPFKFVCGPNSDHIYKIKPDRGTRGWTIIACGATSDTLVKACANLKEVAEVLLERERAAALAHVAEVERVSAILRPPGSAKPSPSPSAAPAAISPTVPAVASPTATPAASGDIVWWTLKSTPQGWRAAANQTPHDGIRGPDLQSVLRAVHKRTEGFGTVVFGWDRSLPALAPPEEHDEEVPDESATLVASADGEGVEALQPAESEAAAP